jgi:DNA-binding MarR family transcriptional regulator
MTKSSYFRFLNLIDTLDNTGSSSQLDNLETTLLNYVAVSCSNAQDLLVNDIISLKNYASPATLHKKIKILVAKGYIELIVDVHDGRKKSVVLTKKAHKYFDKLSSLIEIAVRA